MKMILLKSVTVGHFIELNQLTWNFLELQSYQLNMQELF